MRKWHRWISIVAALFLLSVAITGVILQFQQFFGEEEAQREKLAGMTSTYALDTSGADVAAKIDRTRAAAAAKHGDAKLDAVEIQLKGEHPTVTFHVVGIGGSASPRKLVVNADTGAIEKDEPDERESFILRLHTGEVLGDGGVVGGMLWGTALVLLTITGSVLYWQMYKARAKVKGWKKVFWMLPLALLLPRPALAGSPFVTDDPGFAPKGWEIKPAAVYERNVNGDILTAPILDLNYSIVENFKLNLTLAEKTVFPKDGESHTGLADSDFKFKWRFLDEKPGAWWPALSIAPNLTFPTASRSRGIGDGVWRTRLPLQVGKTFGKLCTYGEIGYQWALSDEDDDQLLYGVAAQYQLTDRWNLGIELNGTDLLGIGRNYSGLVNVGAVYTLNDHVQFQAAVGRTILDEDRGGPELLVTVLLQFNF